jgi:hypothetical protein
MRTPLAPARTLTSPHRNFDNNVKNKQVAISGHKQSTVIDRKLMRTGACRGFAVEHT